MHIKLKVNTGQNREKMEKIGENKFECFLKEKPENNMANKKLVELLSEYFGVSVSRIKIVKGHHQSNKIVSIIDF